MQINEHFAELISEFSAANADFMVVGGYAVIAYSAPRYTKDLDIWVDPTPENATRVMEALRAFGAPGGFDVADLATRGMVIHFGIAPFRVDVLTEIAGVPDFRRAFEARTTISVDGLSIPIIGLDDLIANKAAINDPNRTNDAKDLRALLAVKQRQSGSSG